MTAGWVAASTRGRSLLRRTVGEEGARALATAGTWADARSMLSPTAYGAELPSDADRHSARAAATASTVWQLRVLAGWLPPSSSGLARAFAAPIEIGNVEHHLTLLERLDGSGDLPIGDDRRPTSLGSLGTAWPRVGLARSVPEVRAVLARSAWGDPGGDDRASIVLGLLVAWGHRLTRQAPITRAWVRGAAAVLIARERFAFDRTIPDTAARTLDQLVGTRWHHAASPSELADRLGPSASWSLVATPAGSEPTVESLWLSERAVIDRVVTDARKLTEAGRNDRGTVAAVMALMLVDLWRVHAAIESAGRTPVPLEVFDAVA
jgi:hypothetical protein